jgi:hypothetical protein
MPPTSGPFGVGTGSKFCRMILGVAGLPGEPEGAGLSTSRTSQKSAAHSVLQASYCTDARPLCPAVIPV